MPPPLIFPSDVALRRAYWATVFKSLGHVLHLLHALPPRFDFLYDKEEKAAGSIEGMNGNFIADSGATLTLLNYPVTDNLNPGETKSGVPLTSYAVLDKFLRDKGNGPVYSLNHYNYNAQADLLLPRAVSYSAGLIDYFFRGNMEITSPREGIYDLIDHGQFAPPSHEINLLGGFHGFDKIMSNTVQKCTR